MLTEDRIISNYKEHEDLINTYIQDQPRRDKIFKMLNTLGEDYVVAPASSKTWHHNSFPGGYVDHVNRVVKFAFKIKDLYKDFEGNVDFTDEELAFAAIFHDLGKIGDGEKFNYQPQTDNWRREKLQENYTYNPDLQFMLIPDRSLYILQKFGITVTQKEWLGIRLHDGVFDKANEAYFFSNIESSRQKTNIVSVLHTADFLASKAEYDILKNSTQVSNKPNPTPRSNSKPQIKSNKNFEDILKNI